MLFMAFSIASTLNPPKNAWICAIRVEFRPMDLADYSSVKLDRILCGGARIIPLRRRLLGLSWDHGSWLARIGQKRAAEESERGFESLMGRLSRRPTASRSTSASGRKRT
jgi:hypothetical protein